ncbi:hypothetical protein GGR56DRAFT_669746 [Xylariaceae sp. FL0804]|nr:hypothetical protein GGR56DRAFT_669746 [Xylariaceae sp. FL0804]
MPRRVRVPADPAQSRQNQQRCRARRREYVADLERRVGEYEARDARASAGMQRAARAVGWRNERLIALLESKGVSRAEIDAAVHGEPPNAAADEESAPGPVSSSGHEVRAFDGSAQPAAGHFEPAAEDDERLVVCDPTSGGSTSRVAAPGPRRPYLTSCDDAANIIANFQGHGDAVQARRILGCENVRSCHIKNTQLFELMDGAS